jgi:hypothetical protein
MTLAALLCFTELTHGEEVRGDRVMDRVFPVFSQRLGGGQCAYDSARGRLVRFGGEADVPVRSGGDQMTSEWDGTNWFPVTTGQAPTVQTGFKMVYDAARSNIVLFGGSPPSDSTWLYNGTNWIQAAPAHRPPARWDHDMVYDVARSRVVMFGGIADFNTPDFAVTNAFGDTWEWDGTNWTNTTPIVSPPAMRAPQMAYDAGRGVTVLCKGRLWGLAWMSFGGGELVLDLAGSNQHVGIQWDELGQSHARRHASRL